MVAASSQPAQAITPPNDHPTRPKTGPLSSNTVAAMTLPSTPRRKTRPRTYTPLPAMA